MLPGDSAAICAMCVKSDGEFGKKNRYRFQTFTIVNCAPRASLWGESNFGGLQKYIFAPGVLEVSLEIRLNAANNTIRTYCTKLMCYSMLEKEIIFF